MIEKMKAFFRSTKDYVFMAAGFMKSHFWYFVIFLAGVMAAGFFVGLDKFMEKF